MLLLTRVVWLLVLCAMALGCPRIISRKVWSARPPKSRVLLRTPVSYVIFHHTRQKWCYSAFTCIQKVKTIQNYHMDKRGLADISYNFLIGEDGRIYEGRGWRTRGAHIKGFNYESLELAFLGTFSTGTKPSAVALNLSKKLIQCAISKGILSPNYVVMY
ncbi:peptidoglycan recognition protein 3-like [Dermochelys coriacea]|uniref:peptidoglycan recognition protein 3-like n=1 Tax=Dermochelys coriacea TaxID=27794 RepID=UPI001CA8C941|nr:peptidoglycan recognition protein 3-like [Dermochelys coriacea]XP_043357247.1 peptidoglycan recognition protein 3-like [Dermochelys coriacea]XP_043357248.1 peptidoglycan recognition protein 3-like [Dermochelys coriacea]